MSPDTVDGFFHFFVHGEFDDFVVVPTVQEVTGRSARTFDKWAKAHVDAFSD
jgi:hypothetical protein